MDWLGELQLLGQVVLAAVLAGLVGAEREMKSKPAGIRTQMIVGAASALFVGLGLVIVRRFEATEMHDAIRSDPVRIIEAIVTGISFIGAGSIIFHRGKDRVEGVTTAASILLSAGIGMAVALDRYIVAIGLTILTLMALFVVGQIEYRFPQLKGERDGSYTDDDS